MRVYINSGHPTEDAKKTRTRHEAEEKVEERTSSRARTRREYRDKEQEKEHVFRSKINDDTPISDVHLYVLLFLVLHLLLSLLLSITNTQNHSRRRSDACSAHRLGILISADCFSGKCRVERGKNIVILFSSRDRRRQQEANISRPAEFGSRCIFSVYSRRVHRCNRLIFDLPIPALKHMQMFYDRYEIDDE